MLVKKKYESLLIFIGLALIIGSALGSVLANNINKNLTVYLDTGLKDFFWQRDNYLHENKIHFLASEFFKNSKIILFIWLSSFIPLGNFFVLIILFLKGISYGFTASLITSSYKLKDYFMIMKYILPTNLILLSIFIFTSRQSMKFSVANQKKNVKHIKQYILEHVFIFIISLLCIFLITFVNIYF